MKSMCQEARRNSPSVADCRPASSCIRTTSRIAPSSMRRSSSEEMRPAAKSSRALSSSGGRSRLPTWSALNGGLVRVTAYSSLPVVNRDTTNSSRPEPGCAPGGRLFMSGDRSIPHREAGLPDHRKLQPADEHELLDELGPHLSQSLGLPRGPIPDDRRSEVLRETVDFYFQELEHLVASLSSDDLLETLVRHHERILREREQQDLLIPTRIACFSSEEKMVETLREEKQELSRA